MDGMGLGIKMDWRNVVSLLGSVIDKTGLSFRIYGLVNCVDPRVPFYLLTIDSITMDKLFTFCTTQ